jgi:hypothetical protein
LPASLSFNDLAIASLPQFLPLFWLVGYFCRAGLDTPQKLCHKGIRMNLGKKHGTGFINQLNNFFLKSSGLQILAS